MKEKLNTISATCKSVVRQGQVYYICIGVNDMTDKRKEKIAVIVGDTVVIGKHGNEVITGAVSKAFSDVYRYKEKSKKKRAGSGSSRDSREQRNTKNTGTMDAERSDEEPVEKIQILTRRQKLQLKNGPAANNEFEELNKIAEHQRTLVREKNEEMRERLARGDFILANAAPQKNKGPQLIHLQAIKSSADTPRFKDTRKLEWDTKNFCLWVPTITDYIPFHISVIRNVAVQHEDRLSQLRINFNVPGKTNKFANAFPAESRDQAYIAEMMFRTSHRQHYDDIVTTFKNLLKEYNPLAHMKNQGPALTENHGKKPALDDLLLRPQISGKKTVGRLELHRDGFRFKSRKGETVDILIDNLKTAVYMPADEEDVFILHFELKEPLIYGGKRVHHMQFYTQLDAANEDIVDSSAKRRKLNRNSYDKMEDDSSDKVFTQRLTKVESAFEGFIKAVEAETKKQVCFEEPDLDTGFLASVEYDEVRVYTTENCVCSVTTQPYLIIPFDSLEFVAFERVGMINRTFDISFIFKDYSRSVLTISNISSSQRPGLKRMFDSKDIIVFEGNLSLKWNALIKKFSEDMEGFIEDGGWQYLGEKDSVKKRQSTDSDQTSQASDCSDFEDENDEGYVDSEEDEDSGSGDEDDEEEFEFSDPGDAFSEDESEDDDYVQDSQDSLIVKKKGTTKPSRDNEVGKKRGKK